jgi:hypothetical protein
MRPSGTAVNLRAVTYEAGVFVAAGREFIENHVVGRSAIVTSTDGTNWINRSQGAQIGGNVVFYCNGTFIVASGYGIGQSDPLVDTAPVILRQPLGQTTTAGATVTFGVAAAGTSLLSYRWQRNGQDIPGATSEILDLTNVTPADGGLITVVVGNAFGSATSQSAMLVVRPPGLTASFDSTLCLTIVGAAGRVYQLEYKDALLPGINWQTLTNLSLTGPTGVWCDPGSAGASRRFYRVRLLP